MAQWEIFQREVGGDCIKKIPLWEGCLDIFSLWGLFYFLMDKMLGSIMAKNYSSLETERLLLRPWSAADHAPFAQLNRDPEVMRYFPKLLTAEESDAIIQRIENHFADHGFGFWAVELKQTQQFIGFIGLNIPSFSAPFTPTVEIGWRLAQQFWGQGLATEGAIASLGYGFCQLQLPEIVAFTAKINHRSIAVMERLAMTCNPEDDFDHPALPAHHPLQRHCLYRLNQNMFTKF
jgi:RimJ/RimL family protein N-acetyltransferase